MFTGDAAIQVSKIFHGTESDIDTDAYVVANTNAITHANGIINQLAMSPAVPISC